MAYVNFPNYELAAMTPKDVRQVMDHLPHNSATAFLTAWHEACQHYLKHETTLPEPAALVAEMGEYVATLEGGTDGGE